jgi:hypothetical protein
MEAAAGWLEELGEAGGKGGAVVRAFAAVFPPVTRWGEPWPSGADAEALPPFRPSVASYAAALREVMAGRRRVRVAGRWDDAAGSLTLGLVGPGAAASWAVLDAEGLSPAD